MLFCILILPYGQGYFKKSLYYKKVRLLPLQFPEGQDNMKKNKTEETEKGDTIWSTSRALH